MGTYRWLHHEYVQRAREGAHNDYASKCSMRERGGARETVLTSQFPSLASMLQLGYGHSVQRWERWERERGVISRVKTTRLQEGKVHTDSNHIHCMHTCLAPVDKIQT